MKVLKGFLVLLAIAVVFSLVGCGNNETVQGDEDGDNGSTSSGAKQVRMFIVPGGADYMVASGLAQLAQEKGETNNYSISEVNGNIEGIRRVMQGRGDFHNTVGSNASYAYNGTFTFEGEQYEDIRGVVSVPPPIVQFVVRADSNINSLDDFNNRTSIATFQGTAHMFVNAIMENVGKEEGSDYTIQTLPAAEQMDALRDGTVDAFVTWTTVPAPGLQSLDETNSIKILPIPTDTLDAVHEIYDPGSSHFTVEAGTYSGQTEDAITSRASRIYITRADVDEDIVYEFTKFIIENAEELAKYHPSAAEITLENAIESITIPLHPGAERYYKERGLIE